MDNPLLNAFRAMGFNVSSDANYELPKQSEIVVKGTTLVKYIPDIPDGNMVKLIIPDGIKTIGNSAFEECSGSLEGCRLSSSVTCIEDYAFANCNSLYEVITTPSLKTIGEGAFMYSYLKNIDLPEGLVSIGPEAFYHCRSLTNLRIPSTVTEIGYDCFTSMGEPLMAMGSPGASISAPSSLKSIYDIKYIDHLFNGHEVDWYFAPPVKETKSSKKSEKSSTKSSTSSAISKTSTTKTKEIAIDVSGEYEFMMVDVPDNRKRLLNRKAKKTDKPTRYDLLFRSSFETDKYESRDRTIFHYYCDLVNPNFTKNQQKIEKYASSIVSYFTKTSGSLRANAIRHGYMKSAYDMHALRSFVWTSLEWCKQHKSDIKDFGLPAIQALCSFIAKRGGTNYDSFSKGRKHIGAPILVKNEYGIEYDSFVGFRFSRNDKDIESQLFNASSCNLNDLVTLLLKIQPNIETIVRYLNGLGNSQRTDSDKVMESIVAAYCTFAFASSGPFNILKGPDELDEALLDVPINQPEKPAVTLIDGKVIMAGATMIGYRGIESTLVLPEGIEYVHVLDLNLPETNSYYKAETIIYPKSLKEESVKLPDVNKAVFNHDVKSFALYLADGDTFTPCNLRELVFNGTIEKLDGCEWRCGNLTYLELPKGLKSFGKYAFHGAEKLTKVTFPPTVELVEGDLFGKYGDPITITAYENTPSEKIARELARNFDRVTCSLILSPEEQARRDAIEAKKREEQRRLIEEQRRLAEEQRRLAEEQRRLAEEQRRLAEEKRIADINASIDRLEKEKLAQETIVAENGGLFGEKARKRKEAKKKIAILNSQIAQLKGKK